MRRVTKVLAAIVLIVITSGQGWAQAPVSPIKLYLLGGASLPMSDFGDNYKMGYHGGGAIGLTLMPGLEGLARITYHSFDPDLPDEFEADGGRFTALLYGVEGKLNLGQAGSGLFIAAGAGYAKLDVTEITYTFEGQERTDDIEVDDQTYFAIAAGIDFDRMFLEARYVKVLDDIILNELSTDVDEEGSLVFIPLSVGIRF